MATPPPLPIPQQVGDQATPVATLLATLSNALPNMSAEVANAIARVPGQTPDNALTQGQATQGFEYASRLAQKLPTESAAMQRQAWDSSSQSMQQMLSSAGYKGPPHKSSGGFFHAIGHALGTGLHDTLNAAGAPLRAEQHIERTLFAVANPNANTPSGGSWGAVLHALHSPADWARAWDETTSGNRYILPQVERQVRDQYGDQTYQLALKLATGTDPNLLIKNADPNTQQQLAQTIQRDPKLHAAVAALQAGHVSTGRMLARSIGLKEGSGLWQTVSGVTDGTLDWFGDPIVVGGKMQAARAARFMVKNGAGVRWLAENDTGVQRALQDMADHYDNPGYLMDRYRTQGGASNAAIPDITRLKLDTPEKLTQYFADNADLTNLATHSPASLPSSAGGGWMPTLTNGGRARLYAKGQLQKGIDFLADGPAHIDGADDADLIASPLNKLQNNRISTGVGQFAKKLLTIAPPREFDAYDPKWLDHLKEIADMALPRARVNQILHDMASAADLGEKRVIYRNLIKELFSRMGIGDTSYGQNFIKAFDDAAENPASLQKYASGDIDMQDLGRGKEPVGILEPHLTAKWAVPDYKTLYAQSKKLGITHAVMGIPNSRYVDHVMQTVWKPLSLARVGFAVRVAGEEAFGMLLRDGPLAYAKARAAITSLKSNARIDPNSELYNPAGPLWGMLTSHFPLRKLDAIKTPADLVATHLGDMTYRALAKTSGVLAGRQYENAIRMGYDNVFGPAFADYVSAAHGRGAGYLDGDVASAKILGRHGRLVPAALRRTAGFTEYGPGGELFAPMWHLSLQELASSPWSRAALESIDEPYVDRINKVADAIEANPNMAKRGVLWNVTSDGRRVPEGEATRREATTDWARRIIDNVDMNVRDSVGQHIDIGGGNLAQHLLDVGRPPSVPVLESIPNEMKPLSVKGPDMVPVMEGGTGFFTKTISGMFDVIGRQINWMSRQPMFIHNFTTSVQDLQPQLRRMLQNGVGEQHANDLIVKAASERAVNMTLPYIHNPELRSQFSNITRNLMPFWFAQEQFYKRWARNMVFSPWSFRQAQLISQGVQHSGFVHKDPTSGQEYFIYPGSTAVQDVLTHALTAFGYKSFLPIGAALRGQVNQASPGLERLGLPTYGPLVVIPLNLVKQWFPESIRRGANSLMGPQAASSSFLRSLFPTTIYRIMQDAYPEGLDASQYASAMMQAIQYSEATGHGIGTVAVNNLGAVNWGGTASNAKTGSIGTIHMPPGDYKAGDYVTDVHGTQYVYQPDGSWKPNDPATLEAYKRQISNWARIFLVTRTIFGFNAPASPEYLFDPNHITEDLQQSIKTMGVEQGLAAFLKEHPNATAYTVFQTQTKAGDPLPATKAAMSFMDANSSFMNSHNLAGAYFIPQVDSTGKFDLQAYEQQLTEQLRLRKSPTEFWQEIAYNQAATIYFNAEDRKNQLLQNPGSVGMTKQQIDYEWNTASQQFLNANPLFAKQLGTTASTPGSLIGGESTTYSRADLLKDLVNALNDPNVPQTQQTGDIKTLVNSYIALETMVAQYGAPGTPTLSSTQRYAIEQQYAAQVIPWVQSHQDVQALFNRLVRPTLSSVLNADNQVIA